jgi:MFS transporter, ACS family, glucarate transporter
MKSDSLLKRLNRRPQVIFGLAAATSFLLYLHRFTWNLVRPELEAEYQLSNTQLEALGSAFFFPYALGQIPGGILCDLFGPHIFLVVIIIAWSALLPLHGLTGNFTALLAVRGGFGLSQAGCYPALSQVTRAWFAMRYRTQIQGWIASAFGRGGGAMASIIMGSFLMGYLQLHWLTSLWVLSASGIIFALIFLLLFRNSPPPISDNAISQTPDATVHPSNSPPIQSLTEAARDSQSPATGVLPFRLALKNRSYVILLCQQFLNAGSDVVFVLIMGSYFLSMGSSTGQLGLLISLPLWGGALGGIFGGYANDWAINKFSSRRWSRSTVASIGLTTGGLLVYSAVAYSDPISVAMGLMFAKFFVDWSQPTVWGTCTDLGGRYSATVFGMNNMCGNMGSFITPFAVGLLLDFYSTVEIIDGAEVRHTNYVPAFILSGSMMLSAAVLWLFIDCTRKIVPETDPT